MTEPPGGPRCGGTRQVAHTRRRKPGAAKAAATGGAGAAGAARGKPGVTARGEAAQRRGSVPGRRRGQEDARLAGHGRPQIHRKGHLRRARGARAGPQVRAPGRGRRQARGERARPRARLNARHAGSPCHRRGCMRDRAGAPARRTARACVSVLYMYVCYLMCLVCGRPRDGHGPRRPRRGEASSLCASRAARAAGAARSARQCVCGRD